MDTYYKLSLGFWDLHMGEEITIKFSPLYLGVVFKGNYQHHTPDRWDLWPLLEPLQNSFRFVFPSLFLLLHFIFVWTSDAQYYSSFSCFYGSHIYMCFPNILFSLPFDFIERVSFCNLYSRIYFFHRILNCSDSPTVLHVVHLILLLYNIPLCTCTVCNAHLGYFQDFAITSSASMSILVHVQELDEQNTCEQNCWIIEYMNI